MNHDPIAPARGGACRHGVPLNMTCGPCDRILPANPEHSPARGCAWGLVLAAFLWVAILGGLAMIVTLLLS